MSTDDKLVKQFHSEIVDLIKKYQFRDRNKMASCGLSVSQCYILETLHRFGPLPMQHLADKMHLSISTVTRVLAPLVTKKLATRVEDPRDLRVRVIYLTKKGEKTFLRDWKVVMEAEKQILESFPPERRAMLIEFLEKMNMAFGNWDRHHPKRK